MKEVRNVIDDSSLHVKYKEMNHSMTKLERTTEGSGVCWLDAET